MTESQPLAAVSPPASLRHVRVAVGSIGDDIHVVGITILAHSLRHAGVEVIQLGVQTLPEEFIEVAVTEDVDALFVSSSNGHAAHFCRDLRQRLQDADVGDVLLYGGGNLAVSAATGWEDTERAFLQMGFDRVFPPGTAPGDPIAALADDVERRRSTS